MMHSRSATRGWLLTCVALAFLFTACNTRKRVVKDSAVERDSVRVEYRTERILVLDTVWLEIPMQYGERTTRDSVSRLETGYAWSEARVSGGVMLYHILENKAQRKAFEVQRVVEMRDSVIYKTEYRDKIVVTEAKLSLWERFLVKYGGYTIAIMFILCGILLLCVQKWL